MSSKSNRLKKKRMKAAWVAVEYPPTPNGQIAAIDTPDFNDAIDELRKKFAGLEYTGRDHRPRMSNDQEFPIYKSGDKQFLILPKDDALLFITEYLERIDDSPDQN